MSCVISTRTRLRFCCCQWPGPPTPAAELSPVACLEGRCEQRALRFWPWSGTGLPGMLLLALNFVGEMERVQAKPFEANIRTPLVVPVRADCFRCHQPGSPTTEERHISSRTAASILYACKCSLSELLCACPTIDLNNPRRTQPQ